MTVTEFTSKWKTHLLFLGLLITLVVLNAAVRTLEGESLLSACLGSLKELNPTEIVLFVALWYGTAFGATKDEWQQSFTVLNLHDWSEVSDAPKR